MKKIIFLALTVLMLSCAKEDMKNEVENLNLDASVKVENGILVFETEEDFNKTQTFLSELSIKDLIEWERSKGFDSREKLYYESCYEMEQYYKTFEANGIDAEQFRKGVNDGTISEFPDLTEELIEIGIFQKIEENAIRELKYNPINSVNNRLINKEGFILIENTLYKFDNNTIKSRANSSTDDIVAFAENVSSELNKELDTRKGSSIIVQFNNYSETLDTRSKYFTSDGKSFKLNISIVASKFNFYYKTMAHMDFSHFKLASINLLSKRNKFTGGYLPYSAQILLTGSYTAERYTNKSPWPGGGSIEPTYEYKSSSKNSLNLRGGMQILINEFVTQTYEWDFDRVGRYYFDEYGYKFKDFTFHFSVPSLSNSNNYCHINPGLRTYTFGKQF